MEQNLQKISLKIRKIILILFGVTIMGLGTGICNSTGLGIDPVNALGMGIAKQKKLPLGLVISVIQLIIIIVVLLLDKSFINLGTLIPMAYFGYALQFFTQYLPNFNTENLMIKIIIFLLGLVVVALGMSIYMGCEWGLVGYDALAYIFEKKTKKRPFIFRVCLDAIVALIAFLVHGPVSLGTILFVMGIGPLIDLFRKYLINPLYRKILFYG